MGELTALIARAHQGDGAAQAELFTQVYAELKRVAGRQVRRMPGAPLQTTTLVHETYLRLIKPEALGMTNREHFFAVAGRAMRQLLIDEVRARQASKRGEGQDVPLDIVPADVLAAPRQDADVLALEQALTRLAALDPALTRLVEMRFFAGLELSEIAEITQRSERSLKRDWRKARAFLHAQLGHGETTDNAEDA